VSEYGGVCEVRILAAVPGLAAVNKALPVVSGSTVHGNTLTTTNGLWENIPYQFAYQWRYSADSGATWTNLTGATSKTYTTVVGDVGHLIDCVVTATNGNGSVSATTAATAAIS
ncbi:MAG: hypothetical protein KGR26_14270, partial [Cyanobacteria bacterium REEB65]|nr:hypothetical protein [Cyanobacteria bacterium REEB65]